MLITEETQVINKIFLREVNIMSSCIDCLQCTVVHIYICFVTTELLYRQTRVPKSQTASKPRHTPLRQSRPYQSRACFFFVFHFELTPFFHGQLSKVSARPAVFN